LGVKFPANCVSKGGACTLGKKKMEKVPVKTGLDRRGREKKKPHELKKTWASTWEPCRSVKLSQLKGRRKQAMTPTTKGGFLGKPANRGLHG